MLMQTQIGKIAVEFFLITKQRLNIKNAIIPFKDIPQNSKSPLNSD
jgi:hypothetical protein